MIGTTLGSYRIVREIGAGGMGVVYVAEHPMIGKRAAIKLLRPELSRDTEIVGRFFNEAKAVTTINHPGLVDVYDFGYAADGSAYIVMEFLEGESLAARLRRDRTLHPDLVTTMMRQLAGALGAAHAHRIVHRDLKPDNIFLSPDPDVPIGVRAKVLDFGIAKLAPELGGGSTPNAPQTRTGMMMGTPSYMAPEQCRGAGAVDARADIYALGVILFEMLCGRVPFEGEGIGEVIAKHQYEPPPRPRDLAPNIPPRLEALILKMLEKKPEARPQTMDEIAATLGGGRAASAPGLAATVATLDGAPHVGATTTLSGSAGAATSTPKRGSGNVVLAIGAVAVIAGIVIFIATRGGSESPQHAAAPSGSDAKPAAPEKPAPPPPEPVKQEPAKPAAPTKVLVELESTPPGAEIYRKLDGARVGKTPWQHEYEQSDAQAVFILKLANHKDSELEIDLSKPTKQLVKLAPIKRAVTAPAGPTTPNRVDAFKK